MTRRTNSIKGGLLGLACLLLTGCNAAWWGPIKDNPRALPSESQVLEEARVRKLSDEQLAAEIKQAGRFSFDTMPWVLKAEAAKRAARKEP